MRKTFAARIYDHFGGDLVKTQRALGHRCIESTAAYVSFRQEEIDQAILSLLALVFGPADLLDDTRRIEIGSRARMTR